MSETRNKYTKRKFKNKKNRKLVSRKMSGMNLFLETGDLRLQHAIQQLPYKAPRWFFKQAFEKISRRSAESIIPASKEIEKERTEKMKTKHPIIKLYIFDLVN